MEEVWKEIPGWEGFYEASNMGRIRSLHRCIKRKFNGGNTSTTTYPPKVLKPMSTKFDYLKYGLSRDGKVKSYPGHRLVAMAWLPNVENLPQVHHKDHNKHNNCVENLEWVSGSKNVKEAIKAGRHHGGFKNSLRHHNSRFTDDQILWMRFLAESGHTLTELEKIFNTSRGTLSPIINNKKRVNSLSQGFTINCKPCVTSNVYPQLVYSITL